MYERILVPTDGSNASDRAVKHAITLADQHDAELHAIHVIDTVQVPDPGSGEFWDQLEAYGHDLITNIIEQTTDLNQATSGEVVTGTPGRKIVSYADDNDIDLIIMGTHGRQGAARFLLGSVTERVIRRSTIPVLAVPIK